MQNRSVWHFGVYIEWSNKERRRGILLWNWEYIFVVISATVVARTELKQKNMGVHKAAVVLWPGGHAIQRLRVWGACDIIGRARSTRVRLSTQTARGVGRQEAMRERHPCISRYIMGTEDWAGATGLGLAWAGCSLFEARNIQEGSWERDADILECVLSVKIPISWRSSYRNWF